MTILAIDPGITGAFAWVSAGGHLIAVSDMPIFEVRGKNKINAAGVRSLMMERAVERVVIEGVGAMPRKNKKGDEVRHSASSSFSFGYGAGVLEGVAIGLGLPVEIIAAAVWKRRAGVTKDKGACRMAASRFWPGAVHYFLRVRDDGRAEAALLGRWAGETAAGVWEGE